MGNMQIIYGGSFNPPTKAHFEIAKFILNKYPHSEIVFLPTASNYQKPDLKSDNERCEMLNILCSLLSPRARVSRFEMEQTEYMGTYYAMRNFKDGYFVLGADNLLGIEKWKNYPLFIEKTKFIVIPRDDINVKEFIDSKEILKKNKNNFIILEDFDKIYISSSEYRKSKDNSLLIDEVVEYIEEKKLY